jgi:hypothetical protein
MTEWRFIASRLDGTGGEDFIDFDLPLDEPEVHQVLNGPGGLTASIPHAHLRVDGAPVFVPWSTAIYAEASGVIRGGGILTDPVEEGPKLSLDCVGFPGYLGGTRYTGIRSIERGDPLKVSRHLWEHTQARKSFDLGVEFVGASSSREMFIGDDDVPPSATPQKVDPYELNYWSTHDLAKEFDHLAELAPFEYRMEHAWDGDRIRHRLRYGYPTLGARRTDLRFVVGENVLEIPKIEMPGEEYASHVIVLGAGEGRSMMRDEQSVTTGRLGRDVVVSDKTITTPAQAKARAQAELKARTGTPDVTDLQVIQHPNAVLGSYQVGDEIALTTAGGWTDERDLWVKILGIQITPGTDVTTLQVRRAEKVN